LISTLARRVAERVFQGVVRVIPRRHRFRTTYAITRVVPGRVLPRSVWRCPAEPVPDLILWHGLRLLDGTGFPCEVPLTVSGLPELDEAIAAGRGVMLVGPHTRLTERVVRHLRNEGRDVVAVSSAPREPARSAVPRILLSPYFLVAVRESLAEGKVVFAMIDHESAIPGKTVTIPLAGGSLHVSDALLRLAARCATRTLFIASRATAGGISCTIAAPRAGDAPVDVAGLPEFSRFVREHVGSA
jgi:hypothetical protein